MSRNQQVIMANGTSRSLKFGSDHPIVSVRWFIKGACFDQVDE